MHNELGLQGVASDVMFGKRGPRVKADPSGLMRITKNDGSTPARVKGAAAEEDDDFVTKEQLASLSAGVIGEPTDGSFADGLIELTSTTKVADGLDGVNEILAKLAPSKPVNLSAKALAVSGLYTALEAGTSTSHSDCTDDTTPTASVNDFYDGDAGRLTAEIDGSEPGVSHKDLTSASDVGAVGALTISADEDPYAGQAGKQGFWKQLDASITPASPLSYAAHTLRMVHSITGATPAFGVHIDNPGATNVSSVSHALPGSCSRRVSGVPSLASGDNVSFSFTVNNAVGKHYNPTRLAQITGAGINNTDIAPPETPPAEGAAVPYSSKNVAVIGSRYVENFTVSIAPYNSKNTIGTASGDATQARIDTVSDESARLVSGIGLYPASGYGGAWNASETLKAETGNNHYCHELQMLNGLYQIPTGDYSSNLPTPGPNYSAGMWVDGAAATVDYRWVTFKVATLSSKVSFLLTLNGTTGNWSGANNETSGLKVLARVDGSSGTTGWVDANKAYPGSGNPTADGDAAMVYADSSYTAKKVTFGTAVKTGDLYVRIGIPTAFNKKFTGVTVSNIA